MKKKKLCQTEISTLNKNHNLPIIEWKHRRHCKKDVAKLLLYFGTLARRKNSDNVVLMWKLKVFRDMIRMSVDRNEWMQFDEACKEYSKPNGR